MPGAEVSVDVRYFRFLGAGHCNTGKSEGFSQS